eukprot:CAMPEP_0172494750 /NCGR_PEP_ID=MMETSP1066-20121228/55432_1 /TAXON_ID=671091 /ORGANISM="Coscinodiscus wailesii, Strain CCMP2513" /LENGTH=67 /DNA_ID=CAMNT_0013265975 /DNA_START=40 /DNA_END=240 /DNA_ORIENTATION=-
MVMIDKTMRKYDDTIYNGGTTQYNDTTKYGETKQYGDTTNMTAAIYDTICGVNDMIRYMAATTSHND